MADRTNKKMRRGEKAFFAMADLYGGGGQALIGVIYPLFFLVEVLGLSAYLAGLVILISELWDAISDPIMGIICDNTRTKMGRRRPYILAGGFLLIVAFALIFFPVGFEGEMQRFVYCTITYLFYNTVSTVINVSYSSMSAEISTDGDERDSANVLRLVVSTVGTAACTILPSIFTGMLDKGQITPMQFYLIIGIGFGIFFALPVILCAIFVSERVSIPEEKTRFDIKEFIAPLKIKPFRHLLGMYLGQAVCMEVFSAGIIIFAKYVTTPKGSSTVFLGIFIAVQLLAFPIINKLIKTKDVNLIYRFGLPLSVVALLAFGIFGSSLYVAYGAVFLLAVGFAGAQLTSWIMFPHVVDAGELITGKRHSGGCSALMTFARKTGAAIVINIFTIVLELTGYNSDAEVQTVAAQNGIKYVMALTCIAFMTFGFIMARKYKLSKKKNEEVEKYLSICRDGGRDMLSSEEKEELSALIKSIS